MKVSRLLRSLILLLPVLAACSPASNTSTIYTTVAKGSLKTGSPIPAPSGDVVLTVDGMIAQKNSADAAQFDMPTLESVGLVSYDVNDPFAKKVVVYSGVLLSQLLEVVDADSNATTLTLKALDDYSADMKIADAKKWPVLVATQADGAYMPVDKSGPLISVWPFDDFPEIDHITYDALWLWSLSQITVK